MAYTTDRYNPLMRKRDDRKDLLKDAEDAFYGGGQAQPAPTPTPTPKPSRVTQFLGAIPQRALIAGDVTNAAIQNAQPSMNAAGRVRRGGGILNVSPSNPVSGSRYLGPNGTDLGPQYDPTGAVNPLPKGAVGVQGGQNAAAFNRSLNGSQPQVGATPTPQMTHTQMAEDIARRNLSAVGSLLGAQQNTTPSLYPQRPASYPITPEGNINFNVPGGSMEDALSRYGGSVYTGGDPSVGALDNATRYQNDQGQGVINTPSGGQIVSGVGTDELTRAGIRPGRYADALGPISRSGTGYSFISSSGGKVDIAGPPPDQQRKRDQGYGSAYGY